MQTAGLLKLVFFLQFFFLEIKTALKLTSQLVIFRAILFIFFRPPFKHHI